ncbi:tetratricopeptide repeat-containing glycosyltransferase family 2 protein [Azohydromonas caseinilytica]|uniref:Glycosyltransferase family 2 protein n=1 Tax=Azohydromonas caseinilytica TaxID=2728836 RepID=A0A848FA65_9BURK|nr:glycosyltransferase family 2 protein [Azohydromonas caseinilytica]NML14881.1 glycosyltransferase family 2 protein [Azohydromonas caseinilytica]
MSKKHKPARATPHAQPDLALVVIARDEARCIARCLQSAKAVVRRMLVLDTGSTDDTVAIARSCGAQVHHAPWNDDFAAARNLALELADADWNLVLDADEWLEGGAQCLRGPELRTLFLGQALIRSDLEIAGRDEQGRAWIPRLLPRGVRYEGRIHEQPVSELPRRRLPLVIGHDGYLPAQRTRKAGRNLQMLLQETQHQPDNAYLAYQLGTEHELAKEFLQASDQYEKALQRAHPDKQWRREAAARLVYCLAQSGEFERAIVVSGELMDECQGYPDYFFALGNLFLDVAVANPEQALEQWLPMAEAAWLRCLEIGERPELDGVRGSGSFSAAHNLAVLYEGTNDAAKARRYHALARQLRAAPGPRGARP